MSPAIIRKLAVLMTILVVIVVAVLLGFGHLHSFQKLRITVKTKATNLKISLYRLPPESSTHEIAPEKFLTRENLLQEVRDGEILKLKKGHYMVVSSGNADYTDQKSEIGLDENPETVVVDPVYTPVKLATNLASERSSLLQVINPVLGPSAAAYTIDMGKLYLTGEWYGTTLKPKQAAEADDAGLGYVDIYRLVAHKENGSWKVITKPPELFLSHVKYPDVPRDILIDINKATP